MGHRESLAGPSNAHQRLESRPALDAGDEPIDGLRLIPLRLKRTDNLELAHGRIIAMR